MGSTILVETENLETLRYEKAPHGLIELRRAFKDAGYREQERKITFALKRSEREIMMCRNQDDSEKDKCKKRPIEATFNLVFFEFPVAYGMNPGRALTILLTLLIPFTVIYAVPISTSEEFASYTGDTGGIYRIRSEGSIEVAGEKTRSVTTQDVERLHAEGIPVLLYAFHFSLLSAFHIGWRELNVGNWLARLQKQEYTLRARGWVRTVSGVQSLISIYLLAIWALSYFGRPFG